MRIEGILYCDFCKDKVLALTNCFKCGKHLCKKHGKAVRDEKNERWLGYLCPDCLKAEKKTTP